MALNAKLQIIMGNAMQIAIEALAVFYFDFVFVFFSFPPWPALSKVAAGDTTRPLVMALTLCAQGGQE